MNEAVAFRHPELGFTMTLPPGSAVLDPPAGCVLVAVDAGVEEGFRTNLVVTVDAVAAGTTAGALADAALALQAERLELFLLLDRAPVDLAGGAGERSLAHHVQDGWSITLEQWRLVDGERGFTVSASSATLDHDAVADALTAAAESFAP